MTFSIHTLENFNPALKVSISNEIFNLDKNFNLDLDNSPQKGALLCGSLESFILD